MPASPGATAPESGGTEAPATPQAARAHHYARAMRSGFEGREAELGAAMEEALVKAGSDLDFRGREAELGLTIAVALKTLQNVRPYVHEANDAVVKAHLLAIQFAKDRGILPELVAADIRTMRPVNQRLRTVIEKAGDREIALIGMFDHTGCHYQLILETRVEPGRRSWQSPFRRVLEASRAIGQFNLTEQEIHEQWTRPRLLGYASDIGVRLQVSGWQEDGTVTVELVD